MRQNTEATAFYGKYRGTVTDNNDPQRLGRIRAHVEGLPGREETGWAMPCAPFGGAQTGFFAVPKVRAGVWIEFEHGDPDLPIWTGCWWGNPTEMPPTLLASPSPKVLLQTEAGHSILLDDTPGVGGITLQTANGQKVSLTATGIEIDNGMGATITLQGPQVSINSGALEVI
jgi:uncharacterized protein involved in type VI secretion and phage assembly